MDKSMMANFIGLNDIVFNNYDGFINMPMYEVQVIYNAYVINKAYIINT